jgi:hypothetical protein
MIRDVCQRRCSSSPLRGVHETLIPAVDEIKAKGGVLMRRTTLVIVVLCAALQAAHAAARVQALQAPAVAGAAGDIPGVVKGGTPIQRILTGYDGLDDPIGLSDGTLVFSEPGARRLHRLNTRTNEASVLVAESNESHGVTEAARGRLISAQAW